MATLTPISAGDFERIAAWLGPCELVAGEIRRQLPATIAHAAAAAQVAFALGLWNSRARRGHVLTNEAGIVVAHDPDTVRGADVLFISYDRLPTSARFEGFLTVPPELVVEVLGHDESWSRIEQKVGEYHALGVDLAWVSDPQTQTVRVYPRGEAPRLLQAQDQLDGGALLPGFRRAVAGLFATR
jgi:Uma2 family endonuclease